MEKGVDERRKQIRTWTWVLLIFFILANLLVIIISLSLGTLTDAIKGLFTSWSALLSYVLIILSLIGLFMYKKWGFYLVTVYFIFTLGEKAMFFDFIGLIIYLVVYGYLIWYRAFYKNLSSFE